MSDRSVYIRLLLAEPYRSLLGSGCIEESFSVPVSVGAILERACELYPRLAEFRRKRGDSWEYEFVVLYGSRILKPESELAQESALRILPPLSGG